MNPSPTGTQNHPLDDMAVPPTVHPGDVDTRTPPLSSVAAGDRWASRTAAGVAVLAAALTVVPLAPPPRGQSPVLLSAPPGCAVPSPTGDLAGTAHTPQPTRLRSGQPARPILLDLAVQIAPDACDPTGGRYNVVHHRAWTNTDGGQTTRDVVRWYADDDSGAELMTRYPALQSGVAKDFWAPGRLHHKYLFRAYHSTDWLRSQAHLQTVQADDNTALLAGLASLATWHSPGPPQRALTARVLADTAGLTAHPGTVDRAGRTGIGVASTSDNGRERHLLILHPSTGAALAYEHATLTPTGWQTRTYLLLLTRTHATGRWWEPPADNTPPPPQPDRREMPRQSGVWRVPADKPCTTELASEGAPR